MGHSLDKGYPLTVLMLINSSKTANQGLKRDIQFQVKIHDHTVPPVKYHVPKFSCGLQNLKYT